MSIIVVCPGCLKSYKVSDKSAGKSWPRPNCKRPLQIPTKESEVKVHVPEAFAGGGKSAAGKLVTKPIAHIDVKLKPVAMAILVVAVVAVLVVTWFLGRAGFLDTIAVAAGLLIISPPLAVAAYEMLRPRVRAFPRRLAVSPIGRLRMGLWAAVGSLCNVVALHCHRRSVELVLRPSVYRRGWCGA